MSNIDIYYTINNTINDMRCGHDLGCRACPSQTGPLCSVR